MPVASFFVVCLFEGGPGRGGAIETGGDWLRLEKKLLFGTL
jgi:hypothetical protein